MMHRLNDSLPLLSFADARSIAPFIVVNDGVMGGVSSSRVSHAGSTLMFEGLISLENNGGFASFRGPVSIPDAAGMLRVALRGDGKRYKLTLRPGDPDASWQYQAPFATTGSWQTLRFASGDFAARFRGRPVDAPPLHFGQAAMLGVLISEQQAGPFRLEIQEVWAE